MNSNGCGRKRSWPIERYYLSICLERLKNTWKNLSQDSLSPDRDFSPGLPVLINLSTTFDNQLPKFLFIYTNSIHYRT